MNDSSCGFDIIYKTLQINTNCLSVRATYAPLPGAHAAAVVPASTQRQSVKLRKNGAEKTLT